MPGIETLLIGTLSLYTAGIAAAFLLPKEKTPVLPALFGGTGSLLLLFTGIKSFLPPETFHAALWTVPGIGTLTVSIDTLSAFFLVVTAIAAIPASVFAATRLKQTRWQHPEVAAALYLGLLISLTIVIIASHVFLFLIAWESMSIIIYLLISSDNNERPGYLMLSIGEAGTLAITAAFLLLSANTGSLSFAIIKTGAASLGPGVQWAVFLLVFFGFSVKGGLIPLNFWMPGAYTAAPAAFIPLIAGATLNMALYGIIRVTGSLLPIPHAGPGIIMLIVGSATALIGILYATIEDDFKTLLAHSSIENAGIIIAALGAGSVFLAKGHLAAASIAFAAALYHLLNHSVFKTLLFMGAGAVEDKTGTRSLDRMGGLLKHMPWTGLFVLIGALSIAAMPPFNGFVSEWLTLQALLRSVELSSPGIKLAFVAAGVGLTLTAGLAVTCFVRAFAMGFLGMSRSDSASAAKETGKPALLSMAGLAVFCLALGILPTYVIPALNKTIRPLTGASATTALVPGFFRPQGKLPEAFVNDFHKLGAQIGKNSMPGRGLAVLHRGGTKNPVVFAMSTFYMFITLIILLGLTAGLVRLFAGRRRKIRQPRWDGGVRKLLPEMTYTATGFAHPVRVIFESILRPKVVERKDTIAEHFRVTIRQKRNEIHLIDRMVLNPLDSAAHRIARTLAKMHNGRINTYAGYALLALIVFLAIASII
ncbi:MAG: hypothetical protein GXO69_05030 [Acidobacteria bacterium]|nr:hypothetical protein [Acidobacteriota bacterium]